MIDKLWSFYSLKKAKVLEVLIELVADNTSNTEYLLSIDDF